jgi:hypothetical protein
MSCQRRIYGQGNDSWWLCRGQDGRPFVLHEALDASGVHTRRIEIGDFLRTCNSGPEHQALLRLIGGLAGMAAADLAGTN